MSTEIAWTEETWNPTTGCDRVSAGCDHCYAMTLAKRLKAMGQAKYQNDGDPRTSGPGFGLTTHADALDLPLRWKRPRKVFVNSMSDLFHPDVPDSFIVAVWSTMMLAREHTFQVLTKRPQRLASFVGADGGRWLERMTGAVAAHQSSREHVEAIGWQWPLPNVWLGTSVENQRYADIRIPHLIDTPAAVRFLSVEPMLGPVTFRWAKWNPIINANHLDGLRQLDWAIIGGESGPGARPMELEWAQRIVDECREAGVAVFVKQLGTVLGGKHHQDIDTFPAGLQVREYPA